MFGKALTLPPPLFKCSHIKKHQEQEKEKVLFLYNPHFNCCVVICSQLLLLTLNVLFYGGKIVKRERQRWWGREWEKRKREKDKDRCGGGRESGGRERERKIKTDVVGGERVGEEKERER